jgi:hypothetical protein
MTVSKVTIVPHSEHPQWFLMTIESWANSIGQTKIELLVTQDTLRAINREIGKALPQPISPNDHLPFTNED